MVYAPPRICPRKWDTQNSLGFWDKNGLTNLGQTTRRRDSQQLQKKKKKKKKKKKNKICWIGDFAVPVNHRIKLKESQREMST